MKESIRILVVEDREEHQKIFERIVKKLGYEYEIASSIKQSFALLARFTFHVALVDLSLDTDSDQNRDGFEVIKRINELDEGTKILIITAVGSIKDADTAFTGYKISGFIAKTDEVSIIINRISNAVEEAKQDKLRPSKRILDCSPISNHMLVSKLIENAESLSEQRLRLRDKIEGLLKYMLSNYLPLLPKKTNFVEEYPSKTGALVLKANYWSKSLGVPLVVFCGSQIDIESMINSFRNSDGSQEISDEKKSFELVDKSEVGSFSAAIYIQKNMELSSFLK